MGHVNTQITLKNLRDTFKVKEGIIKESEIRQATVDVMVEPWQLGRIPRSLIRRHFMV
jgi:hypothetical protein